MNEAPPHSEENPTRHDANEPPPAHTTPPCGDTPALAFPPGKAKGSSAGAGGFLKREFFYIIVLLLVVLAGSLRTWRAFETRQPTSSVDPVFQRDLDQRFEEKLEALKAVNHPRALFAVGVGFLNLALLCGGIGIALVVLALWISRGCILAPMASDAPPWGLWDVLKVAALFAGGGALFMLILRAETIQAFASPRTPAAFVLSGLLLIGAAIVVAREERGARLEDLGIKRAGFVRGVVLGLLAFVLLQPVLYGLGRAHAEAAKAWPRTIPHPFLQQPAHELLATPSLLAFLLGVFSVVVIAPVAEELLFRGLLLPALRRWAKPLAAVWLSGAFFGAAHASQADMFVFLPMFVMGVVLGYLYDRTRTLAAPLAAHATYNALVVLQLLAYRLVLTAQVS